MSKMTTAQAVDAAAAAANRIKSVGRNQPCPCGSGKKYKDCCLRGGEEMLDKLREKEFRKKLVEFGVPWYKRYFLR